MSRGHMLDIGDIYALTLRFVMTSHAFAIVVDLHYILIVLYFHVFAYILIGYTVVRLVISQKYMTYLLNFSTFVMAYDVWLWRQGLQLFSMSINCCRLEMSLF